MHGVRWIGERVLPRTSNNVAAGILGKSVVARPAPGLGLSGAGETVAVCDTGLDTGEPATIHPDFAGRVAAIRSYPITSYWTPWLLNPKGDDGPGLPYQRAMPKRPRGLPSRQQILDFITASDQPAGKREIARAFGLAGADKIALKALLKAAKSWP